MTQAENETLSRIEKKLDEFRDLVIRHDEQIKNQGRTQKILIGMSGSVFLVVLGLAIKVIIG